jgi:hypothetical protein
MRYHRVQMFLGCAALVAVAVTAYCCGGYGEEVLAAGARVPGSINRSAIRGNLLVALLTDHRLVRVDLTTGATKTLATIDAPAAALDVLDNKACVASKNRVMIVDLADGKITPAATCDHEVNALGFLTPQRVYVQGGPQVKVLDLATGRPVHDFSLGKADAKAPCGGYRTLGRSGNELFISVASDKDAVVVFDLAKGKVTDRISARDLHYSSSREHPTDLCFAQGKVYVLSSRLGYGIWTEKLGIVDLKTRQYTALKLPAHSLQQPALVPGPHGTVFLTSPSGTYQLDATGKRSPTEISQDGRRHAGSALLGVWQGKALVVDGQQLRQLPMPAIAQAK